MEISTMPAASNSLIRSMLRSSPGGVGQLVEKHLSVIDAAS